MADCAKPGENRLLGVKGQRDVGRQAVEGQEEAVLLEKAGLDVPRMLKERTLAAPLAHAEATFLHPLFFGDRVAVEIRRARLGKTSVTIGHRLVKDGRTMAIGTTAHVFVDGKTFKKAEVPPELVGYLKPFQRDA